MPILHSPRRVIRVKRAPALSACAGLLLLVPSLSLAQKVRVIGFPNSELAAEIIGQVQAVPFSRGNNTPILLQAEKVKSLTPAQAEGIKTTAQAGYSVVMLNPKMEHVRALDRLITGGITLRAPDSYPIQAYSLRMVNGVPTAFLLHTVRPNITGDASGSTPSGVAAVSDGPGAMATANANTIHSQAVDRTVMELKRLPSPIVGAPVKDPSQSNPWQNNPLKAYTLALNNPAGVYNTYVNVYALHSCLENTDHYVVTAQADWTATNAHFQSAGTEDGSLYVDSNGNPAAHWQNTGLDASVGYCGVPNAGQHFENEEHACAFVNYPLSYRLTITPPNQGTVTQINAAPAATQGQATTYTSGFSFNIGGTVNVSTNGPSAGISAGATWINTTATTVPPLQVDVGNAGNEGVFWNFQYCTSGTEPDGSSNCTNHVQTNNGCRNRFGDNSGTNPQKGQTPNGKFSNAVQSVHWQAGPDTRVAGQTFDVTVSFTANIADTQASLFGNVYYPWETGGCNTFQCDCSSYTWEHPQTSTWTFEIPYPSTQCQ